MAAAARGGGGGGGLREERGRRTCATLNGSGIQLAVGPQPLWLRNHNSGLAQRIMVKRLATSPHDPLGITDSACKNQSVVVSVQYGPFNPYIPIRSTTIGKSRVAIDSIAMHKSWRSNSDITSVTRPKNLKFQNRSKPGPTSHTGPKTSRAARDRPEPNPRRNQTSRHDIRKLAGASPERRPAGGATTTKIAAAARGAARNSAPQRRASLDSAQPAHDDRATSVLSSAAHLQQRRPAIKRAAAPPRRNVARCLVSRLARESGHHRAPSAALDLVQPTRTRDGQRPATSDDKRRSTSDEKCSILR
ncbi:hypothetical protein F511_32290 [Dorcoceras hygrometricum]|uniref:Uncharacterized protein n=1 Tax=Dorcoceras hygrometricum TaxID=472368 RepID=A0A2Z7CZ03_9LAMI|nr:hypothetical protein F511_32290 [Dorcoceras hygrometricum]